MVGLQVMGDRWVDTTRLSYIRPHTHQPQNKTPAHHPRAITCRKTYL